MYYYAYIDLNGIATGTYGFPSVIDLPNYLYIGKTDDRSVIGKHWNASKQLFEEVVSVKGQKGDKGDKGDRGPRGEVGPEGPRGPAGKDFDGNLTGGVLRVNGKQAVYDSGTSIVFGINNQDTMIAGQNIYSKVAIAVSSDKNQKKWIHSVNEFEAVEFVKMLPIVEYNYKDDNKRRIGVLAQDVDEFGFGKHFVSFDPATRQYYVSISELVFPLYTAYQVLEKRVKQLESLLA